MRILYICTHNRCRSILSEAISNHYGENRVIAASAGSQPVGEVHPLSLKYLQERGISTDNLRSKSWDELEHFQPDVVVTVCDAAAGETCPLWFGQSIQIHWGLEDPSKLNGDEETIRQAFFNTIDIIQSRAEALNTLAQKEMSKDELEQALKELISE